MVPILIIALPNTYLWWHKTLDARHALSGSACWGWWCAINRRTVRRLFISWLKIIATAALLSSPIWATIRYGASGPAYYNELIGGPLLPPVWGCRKRGYNCRDVLSLINENRAEGARFGTRLAVHRCLQSRIPTEERCGLYRGLDCRVLRLGGLSQSREKLRKGLYGAHTATAGPWVALTSMAWSSRAFIDGGVLFADDQNLFVTAAVSLDSLDYAAVVGFLHGRIWCVGAFKPADKRFFRASVGRAIGGVRIDHSGNDPAAPFQTSQLRCLYLAFGRGLSSLSLE